MFEEFKKMLSEQLEIDPAEITMEAELNGDLGLNSVELADLVLLCEDKYDIEIKDDDIHRFISFGDVVNYLNETVQE